MPLAATEANKAEAAALEAPLEVPLEDVAATKMEYAVFTNRNFEFAFSAVLLAKILLTRITGMPLTKI